MTSGNLYCKSCQKYVSMNGQVGDYRCPICGNKTKIGDGPSSMVHHEAKRDETDMEISLREESVLRSEVLEQAALEETLEDLFLSMGLSESAAKQAAKGRSGLGNNTKEYIEKLKALKPGALKEALEEDGLEDLFLSMGLSESAAKQAAKGRN